MPFLAIRLETGGGNWVSVTLWPPALIKSGANHRICKPIDFRFYSGPTFKHPNQHRDSVSRAGSRAGKNRLNFMSTTSTEPRCWCGHLERWHNFAGVCRWCARLELRRPQFNFIPRHQFTTELPEELRRRAADAVERALKTLPGQTKLDEDSV